MSEEQPKKFNVEFADSKLKMNIDSNQDGEKLVDISVNMNEAVQEILSRGEKVAGAKLVAFEFGVTGIKLKLDTDQDGEELLEISISLAEAIDEAGLMKSDG